MSETARKCLLNVETFYINLLLKLLWPPSILNSRQSLIFSNDYSTALGSPWFHFSEFEVCLIKVILSSLNFMPLSKCTSCIARLSIISSWPVQYSSAPLLNQPYLPLQSIFPTPLHFVFPNICLSHKSRNPKFFLPPNNFLMHLHLSQKQWITKVTKGQSKLEIGTDDTWIIKHLKGQLKLWLRNYVLQQD